LLLIAIQRPLADEPKDQQIIRVDQLYRWSVDLF